MVMKDGIRLGSFHAKSVMHSITSSFSFFLSRLAVAVNSSLGSFVLGMNYAPASIEVGFFSGAAKIANAAEMMLSPVSDSLYPHMVRKKDYKLLGRVLWGGMALWFLVIAVSFILANDICAFILGTQYSAAGSCLRILLIGAFFGYPSQMLGYPALTPIGKSRQANHAILFSSLTMILAFVVLSLNNGITVTAVCWILVSANIIHVIYRGSALFLSRSLIKENTSNARRNV